MDRIGDMIKFGLLYAAFGLVLCLIYKKFNKANNKIQFIDIFIMAILVTVSAIRLNTGSDFYSYYLRYNGITESYNGIFDVVAHSGSVLFDSICYVIKATFSNAYGIFHVSAILFYIPLVVFLRKSSKKPYIGLFVFMFSIYYMITNNILRHSFAMLTLFYAYNAFLKKDKKVSYIIFALIASMFHATVLFAAIIIYLGKYIKINRKSLLISNAIGATLFMFHVTIFAILPNLIGDKYSVYIKPEYSQMLKQSLAVVGYVIFYNIITYILIKKRDIIKENFSDSDRLIGAMCMALPISWLAISAWPINRIAIYVYFFAIILVPIVIDNINVSKKRKLIALYMIWCIFAIITGGDNEYYGYDTYITSNNQPMQPSVYVENFVRT